MLPPLIKGQISNKFELDDKKLGHFCHNLAKILIFFFFFNVAWAGFFADLGAVRGRHKNFLLVFVGLCPCHDSI